MAWDWTPCTTCKHKAHKPGKCGGFVATLLPDENMWSEPLKDPPRPCPCQHEER